MMRENTNNQGDTMSIKSPCIGCSGEKTCSDRCPALIDWNHSQTVDSVWIDGEASSKWKEIV